MQCQPGSGKNNTHNRNNSTKKAQGWCPVCAHQGAGIIPQTKEHLFRGECKATEEIKKGEKEEMTQDIKENKDTRKQHNSNFGAHSKRR